MSDSPTKKTRIKTLHDRQKKVIYEERVRKAERMILAGITSAQEISIALGVYFHETNRICATIYERWRNESHQDIDDKRKLRSKQLEVVLQKAHSAFERSCRDVEEFSTEERVCSACNGRKQFKDDTTASGYSDCKSCNGAGRIFTEKIKVTKKVGDPAFLALAKEVVKELAKIDGIVTDKKTIVNNTMINQSMAIGGEIADAVRELYVEAPVDTLMKAKLLLEELDLAEKKKLTNVKSQPGVIVVDKS